MLENDAPPFLQQHAFGVFIEAKIQQSNILPEWIDDDFKRNTLFE